MAGRILAVLIIAGFLFWSLGPGRVFPAVNPDPNHAHADFAVWINGKQWDFSGAKYMTTEAEEEAAPAGSPKKYFHLHDGNGHVIHRHKPGLPLADFFLSIGGEMTRLEQGTIDCLSLGSLYCSGKDVSGNAVSWIMFVNGKTMAFDPTYVFDDDDKILLSYGQNQPEVFAHELSLMTNDACLYSKTCPQRGPAPTESCIADPDVPCKMP